MQSLKLPLLRPLPAAKLVPNNRWNTATPVTFFWDFCNPNIWPSPFAAKVLITVGTLVSAYESRTYPLGRRPQPVFRPDKLKSAKRKLWLWKNSKIDPIVALTLIQQLQWTQITWLSYCNRVSRHLGRDDFLGWNLARPKKRNDNLDSIRSELSHIATEWAAKGK